MNEQIRERIERIAHQFGGTLDVDAFLIPALEAYAEEDQEPDNHLQHKALLIAVGSYIEWKTNPRGFVREPIYNLAKSYREYLLTLAQLPYPTALEHFDRYFGEELKRLSKLYNTQP